MIDGNASACAGERAHCKDESALLHITSKTKDWEYEKEYRLVLDGGNSRLPLAQADRTLSYDFLSLKGIILGMNMSIADQKEIASIVRQKGIENNRPSMEFHQAYYSVASGDIRCKEYWSISLTP